MTTEADDRPVILWFRQDLRLADNPALIHAAETGRPIIPVYILDEGSAVVCVDSLITGTPDNVEHLRDRSGFRFVEADVTMEMPSLGQVDLVFHLAIAQAAHNRRLPDGRRTGQHNDRGLWRVRSSAFVH